MYVIYYDTGDYLYHTPQFIEGRIRYKSEKIDISHKQRTIFS